MTLLVEVPYEVWNDEPYFATWLAIRGIKGFFWEVSYDPTWVVIEVIDECQ